MNSINGAKLKLSVDKGKGKVDLMISFLSKYICGTVLKNPVEPAFQANAFTRFSVNLTSDFDLEVTDF